MSNSLQNFFIIWFPISPLDALHISLRTNVITFYTTATEFRVNVFFSISISSYATRTCSSVQEPVIDMRMVNIISAECTTFPYFALGERKKKQVFIGNSQSPHNNCHQSMPWVYLFLFYYLIDLLIVSFVLSFLFNYKTFRWQMFSRCGVLLLFSIFIVCISKWRTKILDILWLRFTHISLNTHWHLSILFAYFSRKIYKYFLVSSFPLRCDAFWLKLMSWWRNRIGMENGLQEWMAKTNLRMVGRRRRRRRWLHPYRQPLLCLYLKTPVPMRLVILTLILP